MHDDVAKQAPIHDIYQNDIVGLGFPILHFNFRYTVAMRDYRFSQMYWLSGGRTQTN